MDTVLNYKDTGLYYGSNIEVEMTILTEYISQVLERKDLDLIRGTLTDIMNRLHEYPVVVANIIIQ